MKYLDPKQLKIKIKFEPHSAQRTILREMKRFTIICAGRRFGKTLLSSYLALKKGLLNNKNIWICAPTYDLASKSFDYLTMWVSNYFPKGAFKVNFSTLSIDCPFGSKITCKSAENPTSLLGESLDLLILDEASRLRKEVWESYLRPSLSDRSGSMIAISTPFSKENWFYQLFLRGKQEDKNWISFTFPSTENPTLSKEDLEEAKGNLPEAVWNQEYMAQFLDSSYAVFRNVRDCISQNLPRGAIKGNNHIIGIDLAKMVDWSVITIADATTNEIVRIDRWQKLSYPIQLDRIQTIAEDFSPSRIIIDSLNVGGAVGDELRSSGLWVEDFASTGSISPDWKKRGSKQRLIEKLALMFEQRSISIPANEMLIDELESYGITLTPKGHIIYGSASGMTDDCVDSLALAVWGLTGRETKKPNAFQRRLKEKQIISSQRSMERRSDI